MSRHQLRPIEVTGYVSAPPDEVFAFVADTRNDPLWCANVDSAELVEGSGVGVGARFRFSQHLDRPGGERVRFDADVEIVELADRTISWQVSDRFQERQITLSVSPQGEGSNLTQVTRARFRRRPGLVRWVYPRLARRTFARQFEDLAARFV